MEPANRDLTDLKRSITGLNNTECHIGSYCMLPDEWDLVELKDVCLKTENVDPKNNPDSNFKYIDVSSISRESLKIIKYNNILGAEAPSRAKKQIKSQDVIFATVRPSLRRIALVASELDGEVCSTAFCVIRANHDLIDPKFLFYAVSYDDFVNRVASQQRGSSYPAVSNKDVMDEKIALPL